MYCPICLNDTLKIASSGVVKLTFDGKSKSTSQFFYNLSEETDSQRELKLREVIKDYFSYYSEFQNQNTIKEVYAFSSDFKCSNKCSVTLEKKFSILDLVIAKKSFFKILEEEANSLKIPINIVKIKEANLT